MYKRFSNVIGTSFYLVQKDLLQWVRNIENIIYGFLGPIIMFFVLDYLMNGNAGGDMSSNIGIIYMSAIYSSIFISGEPLFKEIMWSTNLELYLAPAPSLYIIIGKFCAGVIKEMCMGMITLIITYIFVYKYYITVHGILLYLLFILNCVSLSILLANIIGKWSVYAGGGGFMGILSAILAGVFIPVENLPEIVKYLSYILPTTHSYQLVLNTFTTGLWKFNFNTSLVYSILFPIVSILISGHWYERRLTKNLVF